jgi:hypothetical protein
MDRGDGGLDQLSAPDLLHPQFRHVSSSSIQSILPGFSLDDQSKKGLNQMAQEGHMMAQM